MFVPVVVSDPARYEATGIEIVLSGGAQVRVAAGVDRESLAEALAALRQDGFAAAPAGAGRVGHVKVAESGRIGSDGGR